MRWHHLQFQLIDIEGAIAGLGEGATNAASQDAAWLVLLFLLQERYPGKVLDAMNITSAKVSNAQLGAAPWVKLATASLFDGLGGVA